VLNCLACVEFAALERVYFSILGNTSFST